MHPQDLDWLRRRVLEAVIEGTNWSRVLPEEYLMSYLRRGNDHYDVSRHMFFSLSLDERENLIADAIDYLVRRYEIRIVSFVETPRSASGFWRRLERLGPLDRIVEATKPPTLISLKGSSRDHRE